MRVHLLVFGVGLALGACEPPPEIEGDQAGECDDGVDNDQDGFTDCVDRGCFASIPCDTPGDETDSGIDTADTANRGKPSDRDGDGTPDEQDCHPEDRSVTCRLTSLSAGFAHTCAVWDGRVRCWGANDEGQLGLGHTLPIGDDELPATASDVDVGGAAVQVSAGYKHTCALLANGKVRCWGDGSKGQLGLGSHDSIGDDETPATVGTVDLGARALSVGAGRQHTCALIEGGFVRCWGLADVGQTGRGDTMETGGDSLPSAASPLALGGAVAELAVGLVHNCVRFTDGTVNCWGRGSSGRLGRGHEDAIGDDETPATAGPLEIGQRVLQLSADGSQTCAVLENHTLRCWGSGQYGRIGYGNTDDIGDDELPSAAGNAAGLSDAVAVEMGGYMGMALRLDGSVRTWGRGTDGRLGYASEDDVGDDEVPDGTVQIGGRARLITAGEHHMCVALLDAAETVRCWGLGADGRLGLGNELSVGDDEMPSAMAGVSYR
ncbi:MAG: hypothetical protein H6732_15200 [Alphaproteobacteria bacterium]|nr:hypothetical protein [Alphaproteobacteria bacterium]